MMEVLGGKNGKPFIRLRNRECLAQGHPDLRGCRVWTPICQGSDERGCVGRGRAPARGRARHG